MGHEPLAGRGEAQNKWHTAGVNGVGRCVVMDPARTEAPGPALAHGSRFDALSDETIHSWTAPLARSICSGTTPGVDIPDADGVVMDACSQPVQVTWSRLKQEWFA